MVLPGEGKTAQEGRTRVDVFGEALIGHFLVTGWPQGIQWGYRGRALSSPLLVHSVYLLGLLEETTYCLPPGDVDQEEQDEEAPQPNLTIPEDLDSREAMVSWALLAPSVCYLCVLGFLPSDVF